MNQKPTSQYSIIKAVLDDSEAYITVQYYHVFRIKAASSFIAIIKICSTSLLTPRQTVLLYHHEAFMAMSHFWLILALF